jgi:C4-dicarboxylate transporter DctM subunit
LLIAVLILLGCFLDSIAILFIITPVIFPIVIANGYDPIWFGIIMIMVVEFGLITPPIGMNVFVLSRIMPDVNTWKIFRASCPISRRCRPHRAVAGVSGASCFGCQTCCSD